MSGSLRELVLLSREGCHLCEEALERIEPWCRSAGVTLRVVDIDEDAELQERYGLRIPVLMAGAEELSGWPLDEGRIMSWLQEES